jgi:hypothetical protein
MQVSTVFTLESYEDVLLQSLFLVFREVKVVRQSPRSVALEHKFLGEAIALSVFSIILQDTG